MLSMVDMMSTIGDSVREVRVKEPPKDKEPLQNRVGLRRTRKGWTQQELADLAGLSRQSIVAIEAGKMAPSTAIALRLAHALACSVEQLFWVNDDVRLLARKIAAPHSHPSERLALGHIGGNWVAHALPSDRTASWCVGADGLAVSDDGTTLAVDTLRPTDRLRDALLVSGCDPALGLLAAHYGERFPQHQMTAIDASSGRALQLLADNAVHIAGSHLRDDATGEFNAPFVRRALPTRATLLFRMASWQLGFVVRHGNPKAIRVAEDLVRPDVRLINREPQAGARQLLDRLLAQAGVDSALVNGHGRSAQSHLGVAQTVALDLADVGVAVLSAARAFGLDFLPLEDAHFDLVVPATLQGDERVTRMLDVVGSRGFRRELAALGGYDTTEAGQLMAEVLPA